MNVHEKCKAMLATVIKSEKNIEVFLKNIYDKIKAISTASNEIENYFWAVYQVIGLIKEEDQKSALSQVKLGKICWDNKCYDKLRDKLEEHDDFITNPFDVASGVVECPKCHSSKTWSVQKQTRGADEPMTTFSTCVECNHSWRYSG